MTHWRMNLAPCVTFGWKNEQFDQLLDAARGETNEAKRKQMYADMQVLVHEQCGVGIPIRESSHPAGRPVILFPCSAA